MASKAKKLYNEGLCIFAVQFSSQMHTPTEQPHAFRPILFDESSLITRLESWGLRKILTIRRLSCNRTGANCEGERSLNTEAVFPICAICLLVQEAHACLLPSAFHLTIEFTISRCISKGIWKILCLSAGISIPSVRQEPNSCNIKGKAHTSEAEKRKMLQADLSKRQLMI